MNKEANNKVLQRTNAKKGKYNYFKKLIKDDEIIFIDTIMMAYKKNHNALLHLLIDSKIENITDVGYTLQYKLKIISDICEKKKEKNIESNYLLFECLKSSNVLIKLIKYFKSESIDYKDFISKYTK